jgi:wyosine [tRNA(Phe)-imidazoG37] synthetase (radical SAM superfamily)
MNFKYVFGPVMSSRLGRSLGLDLLGDKICDFDCLYCEVGKTRVHTTTRKAYVPGEHILQELADWFAEGHAPPEYITLGGLGEPCLNTDIGWIISRIKDLYPHTPVAVLTNSSLLSDPGVREELARADAVLPSLDTVVEKEFKRLNRPHPDISLPRILDGLARFRKEFSGRIFLEILLVPGYNDSEENMKGLRDFCARLSPDRVDLARMTRPGTYIRAPQTDERMEDKWRDFLGLKPGEKRSEGENTRENGGVEVNKETVLASLKRRPQTREQLAYALEGTAAEIKNAVDELQKEGKLSEERDLSTNKIFFSVR